MSLEVSYPARRRAWLRDSLPTEHPGELDAIRALVDQLPDPAELGVNELAGSLIHVGQVRNALDAWLTAVAAEADARGVSQVLCAGTTGTMVAAALNVNPANGSGIVGTGRELRELPVVAQAYRQGLISTSHVVALKHAAPRIEGFGGHEAELVAVAERVEPKELRRLLDVLICQSIPEGPDIDHLAQRDKRSLSLSERPDGMWKIDGLLDGLAGSTLFDSLQPLMAREGPDDPRGPKQRRADALADLVSMARAGTRPLGVSGLTVLIDIDDLPDGARAALEDGTVLGAGLFDLLSCNAAIACLFGQRTPSGFVPMALARTRRRATYAQWQALIARDRGCVRCGKTPRWTQAHHILHWRQGGSTDLSNLCLLCSRCHHDLHLGFFDVTMDDNGIPVVTTGRGPPAAQAG